ncbi:uncharacterized protein LOC123316034 [Coccinella septempunctata]|uniref:uncharacterized protein LOC123316034 n=1 Tax=Coccinella septempunctata TaxID=41139 RepID=UPI001D07CA05|nr:uncharacterized protein LOC123316034 [Coccinella septempunctata]
MNKEGMRLRDRPIMLDNSGPHRPFNVKRKPNLPKQPSRTGSAKLTMQDFVRMDPGYTPNIEHLVFPARKRNPQQVAPINPPVQKTRSRLAEMFALSRHLQQRSADRESKNRVPLINRSVDSALEGRSSGGATSVPPQRPGSIAGDPRRWLQQQHQQQSEEPVRQRISPVADSDMTASRGPNISVLHLRNSTENWDNNSKISTANSRIYPSNRKPAGIHSLTKHQSLGGIGSKFRWKGASVETTGDMNTSEVFIDNQYNRELSPVRWCNREVDGVYLGRSGWVQVQHRSLDDRKISNFRTTAKVTQPQDSKRVAIKLAQYHCKSEPGRFPNSPTKLLQQPQKPLYLSIREPKFDEITKRTPQNPDSLSPPPHTPIISPPPAFQDKTSAKTSPKRAFFGKTPFLPRSNAIDKDVSPPASPPKETFKTCAPMANILAKPNEKPTEKQKKPSKNIIQTI